MEDQHFSHPHPLVLREVYILNYRTTCKICYKYIEAPYYGCDSCGYYIDKECAELAHHINHPFHPSHPLTLGSTSDCICDSCHREYRHTPWYICEKCDFYMDKECALMEPISCSEDNQEHIQHFTHQHPMPLLPQQIDYYARYCFACGWRCRGDQPTYGCTRCHYFLHKSCAELPRETKHPFHPLHPLSLSVSHKSFSCKLCDKENIGHFDYKCQQCGLWLCLECGTTSNTAETISQPIRYRAHEHLVYFVQSLYTNLTHCSAYSGYCKQQILWNSDELDRTRSSVLRCLECDFTVHLLCGPLPSIIKYEYHVHPLTLMDSVIEDDFDEYYCDICETQRDPRIRVYYCQGCKFVAHVHCVVSEITKVLKGDVRDHVELKTVGEDLWISDDAAAVEVEEQGINSVMTLTLKDIINKLNTDGKIMLGNHYKWDEAISSQDQGHHNSSSTSEDELGDEDIARILKLCRFTDEDFEQFISELDMLFWNTKLEIKASDLRLKIVNVEQGYMIPQILAPVLRKLLRKYGDVSDRGFGTQEWKSIMYFILCKVVQSMCTTKVVDITRNVLCEWYHHLIFVETFGKFQIGFARAHLETLILALLGAQANRVEFEIPTKLEQKIAQLNQEIAKKNVELETCNQCRGAPKSDFIKKCVKKASELKWKHACEGLL